MGLAWAAATARHAEAGIRGWSPSPTTMASRPASSAEATASCREVACPSLHRSLRSTSTPGGTTPAAAKSTAPVTTQVRACWAAAACSRAHATSGRPRHGARSLWPAPLKRLPPPAARTTAPVVTAGPPLGLGRRRTERGTAACGPFSSTPGAGGPLLPAMDRPDRVPQRRRAPAGPQGDDLGADRHRRLLGRPGTNVESDGGEHPGQLVVGNPDFLEPVHPFGVGPPGPHRSEVADLRGQGRDDGGHIELWVVREHADRVT